MVNKTQLLHSTLKKYGYSTTRVRQLVFSALDNKEPQSMNQLVEQLTPNVDRASVYRTISLFEKIGVVKRLQLGWKHKLELSDEFTDHHHHIICIKCGGIQAFQENLDFERALKQCAVDAAYSLVNHQIELQGICKQCQKT